MSKVEDPERLERMDKISPLVESMRPSVCNSAAVGFLFLISCLELASIFGEELDIST